MACGLHKYFWVTCRECRLHESSMPPAVCDKRPPVGRYEPEGRAILFERGVADFDLAVATVMLNFGRSEVTRRSRLSDQSITDASLHVSIDAPDMARTVRDLNELADRRQVHRKADMYESDDDDAASENASTSTASTVMAPRSLKPRNEPLVDTRLVLASKRKRSAIAVAMSALHCEYWAAALSSNQVHVLLMLIASSRSASRSAAATTLHRQNAHRPDRMLSSLSEDQAVKSRESLRCLFRQSTDEVPCMMVWRTRDANGVTAVHRGIARSENDLQSTMHAFGKISKWSTWHTRLVWIAAYHLESGESITSPLPGVVEAEMRIVGERKKGIDGKKNADCFERLCKLKKGITTNSTLTGISRCDVVIAARIVVARSVLQCGQSMKEQLESMHPNPTPTHTYEIATLLSRASVTLDQEPFATPSNNLAQGLQVSETLRVLHRGKEHRGDPTRASFGAETHSGEYADTEMAEHHKPSQMIPIVDFEVEKTGPPEDLITRPDACILPCAIRLTLSGESPIRLPEAFRAVFAEAPLEARAMLYSASMQASIVSEEARHALAGSATAASASAKRILLPDFRSLWLTPFLVYRVGHRNVRTSYHSSSWRGAYPAGIELGSGGGIGRGAMFITSDRRQHGKLLAPQEVADAYCAAIAEETVKRVAPTHYDFTPPAVRGVPHLAIPGLHTFLDPMVDGLERLRRLANISERTVDSLQSLPFGPFSEHLSPGTTPEVDQTSNLQFRNPGDRLELDGRSFLPDGTIGEVQIFAEPLVPRLRIREIADNSYASIHEHVDSWFNAANTICILATALLPKGTPEQQVDRLRVAIDAFHTGHAEVCRAAHVVAADACVLLNCMFPTEYAIAQATVVPGYALALKAVVRAEARGAPLALPSTVSPEMLAETRDYWSRFTRTTEGAWARVAPLFEELIRLDGRFDVQLDQLKRLRQLNDAALRACWSIASTDGVKAPPGEHPLAGTTSPHDVDRVAIAPRFCAVQLTNGKWMHPRGALVGSKPGSYRSLLAMVIAVDRIDNMQDVQIFRNEGGLCLRPSSAADIADCKSNPRSDKACSPVGVEGDAAAFGSRESKLVGCRLQREAWRKNLIQIMWLCVKTSLPRPGDAWRFRGDEETQAMIKKCSNAHRISGIATFESRLAKQVVHAVVDSIRSEQLSDHH